MIPLRLTYAVGDEDQENEGWDNGEQVGKEQNQVVHKTSKVTCKKSEEQSDHGCNDSRNQTNFQDEPVAEISSVKTSRPKLSVPSTKVWRLITSFH